MQISGNILMLLKRNIVFILVFGYCSQATAQYSRYIIQLTDKKGSFTLDNPSAYLSAKSLARRTKRQIRVDSTDLPITPAYLDSIRSLPDVIVLNNSKWLNQVLIKILDSNALTQINNFSFVKHIAPIALRSKQSFKDTIRNQANSSFMPYRNETVTAETQTTNITGASDNFFDYAASFQQIHIHKGEYLHNLGFHGEGITIAILDAGFYDYLTNPAFDSARQNNQILGTYDYVNQKQSVNEEDIHGTYCFSIIAANEPGEMVGSAPKASFWLFKTEDVNSEYPVEEQNWIAAAEFADSAGADIISTSLGYAYFDDSSFNLNYAQRDGRTAMISLAANFAVAKGMIVTVSAGNSGALNNDERFVWCPADADSALTIGATDMNGNIAAFSSWGPNASGELKPDVVSVGQGTVIATPNGIPGTGNGTSFSNPNLAGLVACLWQAFPEFANHDIMDAIEESADKYAYPDDHYGYGIPDFEKAYTILENKREFNTYISTLGDQWISVYPVPYTNNFTVVFKPTTNGPASLQLIDAGGRIIESKSLTGTPGIFNEVQFDDAYFLPKGMYFIHYDDGNRKKTLKIIKQ
ncbi:MAG TPA: S8 family peptidase [Puia sp.]|nr:S8 family peptidase [Puia sp.]